MKKDKNSTKNFLVIYAIIIIIALVLITFVIPDDVFMWKYKDVELPDTGEVVEKREFVDYEIQKENLLNNNYDYDILLLDSMGSSTYEYKCEGSVRGDLETGTCSKPNSFSYTESTKDTEFKISTKYLNINEIFGLIEEIEPEVTKYQSSREYRYATSIKDLDTEVVVYTDYDNITKIEIRSAFMTYILKYSNIIN